MGLDISYYQKLRPLGFYDEEAVNLCNMKGFEDRADFGVRRRTEEFVNYETQTTIFPRGHLYAGSYGGYNNWRNELSIFGLGVDAKTVWANPEKYKGRPFYELVNFSDCEGTLGADISAKLARDFWENLARAEVECDEYFVAKYNEWLRAFEYAANDGAVEFH